jgi:hypothetical protein
MTDTLSQAEQHFEQASSLEEQSDFQAALEECEAAIRLDPKFAEAHNYPDRAASVVGWSRTTLRNRQTG